MNLVIGAEARAKLAPLWVVSMGRFIFPPSPPYVPVAWPPIQILSVICCEARSLSVSVFSLSLCVYEYIFILQDLESHDVKNTGPDLID